MTNSHPPASEHPIDVVITWVDGDDPGLAEKRKHYLEREGLESHPSVHPTRFASLNEIRYCVLSVLTFAPFVRNIFLVTDGQDPDLHEEVATRFPNRTDSLKIVDHEEIFRGHEEHLPTFNSRSIETMLWRIEGLSDSFVYFNDDFFLIRPTRPTDWFMENRPVLRGKWRIAPFRKLLKNRVKSTFAGIVHGDADRQPPPSFYLGQWKAASMLGMKTRYFFNCHTPTPFSRKRLEDFFTRHPDLLEDNIRYRFRNAGQFNITTLANHLELLDGNRNTIPLDLAYLDPFHHSKTRLARKLRRLKRDTRIKSICVQSLELAGEESREQVLSLMEEFLSNASQGPGAEDSFIVENTSSNASQGPGAEDSFIVENTLSNASQGLGAEDSFIAENSFNPRSRNNHGNNP